ncbi:hypothetical protein [Nocardia ignorata]|uniref:Uncharacterized protein n=1 Tax=Nocardia ignorata TaxID=145285 RepID=A0A4R6NX20_NOCIG|nr:hypothetical protein [Nocardia ignorata]TDP28399.1 hypothetical protein DFR75_11712 [Nocardia ignorata]
MSTTPPAIDVPPVESISRTEFAGREHLGTAGPVTALPDNPVIESWRERPRRGWRGRYWTYRPDQTGALRLHPLNVARRTRTTR